MKENVYWFCGEDLFIRQIKGKHHVYEFLEQYKKRVPGNKELPFMVDALNCSMDCIYGTALEPEKAKTVADYSLNCSACGYHTCKEMATAMHDVLDFGNDLQKKQTSFLLMPALKLPEQVTLEEDFLLFLQLI